MYVTDLRLSQFRGIASTHVEFQHPDRPDARALELPNVNLLVGLNGGGKSTLLKGIVLGILGPRIAQSGFDREGWVRRGGGTTSEIDVGFLHHSADGVLDSHARASARRGRGREVPATPRRRLTRIRRKRGGDTLEAGTGEDPEAPTGLLAAYGPTRQTALAAETAKRGWEGSTRLRRISSLLDDQATLVPLEDWLPQLKKSKRSRADEVVSLMGTLLPGTTRFAAKMERDAYLFEHNGVAVPFGYLSDGLKSHIAWVGDLLSHLVAVTPDGRALADTPGVVLVDELDNRMHPRWQLRVLPAIAGALPRLQFVVSGHSPLLAAGLRSENMLLLEPDPDADGDGAMHALRLHEEVYGRTADRVLTSSYFNLESTRGEPFRADLRKLVDRTRAGDSEAPIDFIRALATSRAPDPDGTGGSRGGNKRKPIRKRQAGKKKRKKDAPGR